MLRLARAAVGFGVRRTRIGQDIGLAVAVRIESGKVRVAILGFRVGALFSRRRRGRRRDRDLLFRAIAIHVRQRQEGL